MSPFFSRSSLLVVGDPLPFIGCLPTPSVIDGTGRIRLAVLYFLSTSSDRQTTTAATCWIGYSTFIHQWHVYRSLGPVYILLRDSGSCSHRFSRASCCGHHHTFLDYFRQSRFRLDVTPPTSCPSPLLVFWTNDCFVQIP
jgi:hypothetical protein